MSTSTKTPASIRHGGPGASQKNAKDPVKIEKPPGDDETKHHSRVSTGGGEQDEHHTHSPKLK